MNNSLPLSKEFVVWVTQATTAPRAIMYFPELARALESLEEGIVLSQLIYWSLPVIKIRNGKPTIQKVTRMRVQKLDHYWWAISNERWEELAYIKPRTAERAIKSLVDRGLIVSDVFRFNGIRCVHLRINPDGFRVFYQQNIPSVSAVHIDEIDWNVWDEFSKVDNLTDSNSPDCQLPLTETCNRNLVTDSVLNLNLQDSIESVESINLINAKEEFSKFSSIKEDFSAFKKGIEKDPLSLTEIKTRLQSFIATRCKDLFTWQEVSFWWDEYFGENPEIDGFWWTVYRDIDQRIGRKVNTARHEVEKLEKTSKTQSFLIEKNKPLPESPKPIPDPLNLVDESESKAAIRNSADFEKPLPLPPGFDKPAFDREVAPLLSKPLPEIPTNPAEAYRLRAAGALVRGLQARDENKDLVGFHECLRPLVRAFIQESGMRPSKREMSGWVMIFKEMYDLKILPEHIRDGIYHMRRKGLMVKAPFSVKTAANEVRMGQNPEYHLRRFDPDTGTEVPWNTTLITLADVQW